MINAGTKAGVPVTRRVVDVATDMSGVAQVDAWEIPAATDHADEDMYSMTVRLHTEASKTVQKRDDQDHHIKRAFRNTTYAFCKHARRAATNRTAVSCSLARVVACK